MASTTPETQTSLNEACSAEIRATARRVGALSRWLYSFGNSTEAFRVAEEHGLTFLQMKVLLDLGSRGTEATPYLQELAEHLGTTMPSISRGVDSLVRDGLMSRVEDLEDRRRKRVALTDKGKEIVEAFLAARVSGSLEFARALTDEQRELLDNAIESLIENEDFRQTLEQIEEVFPG